jgi:hypothetical protein
MFKVELLYEREKLHIVRHIMVKLRYPYEPPEYYWNEFALLT